MDDSSSEHAGHIKAKDPYDSLGSGMQAYFKMLRFFTVLFLVFGALMVPTMIIYMSRGNLKDTHSYDATKLTLGNMGFSSSQCISQYTNLEANRTLSCTTGKMSQLVYSGLIPNTAESYERGDE